MKKGEKWSKQYRLIMKRIHKSRQFKEKMDVISTERWGKVSFKKKMKKIFKKIFSKIGYRNTHKKWWTKERRDWKSRQMKRAITPEIARIIAKKLKERYRNHPYLRERLSREKQEYYENNPEARKNLIEYWNKPENRIKCKNSTIVKSKGEKIINNTLFESGIKPNYEAIELNFSEIDPVPDFFPSGKCKYGWIKNVFIEFYGGHPRGWKSKVKKNKVYEKYNIPVLILTPYEIKLADFKDYLLKELVKLSNSKEARNFNLKKWQLKRKRI